MQMSRCGGGRPVKAAAAAALAFAAENYLLTQTERSFGTLDYYKQFR